MLIFPQEALSSFILKYRTLSVENLKKRFMDDVIYVSFPLVATVPSSALNVSGSMLIAATGTIFEVANITGGSLFAVEDSSEVQVIVAAQPAQTGNPFEVRDAFDDIVAYVDVSGNISGNNVKWGFSGCLLHYWEKGFCNGHD